jgi:signal transduction histidine kinase
MVSGLESDSGRWHCLQISRLKWLLRSKLSETLAAHRKKSPKVRVRSICYPITLHAGAGQSAHEGTGMNESHRGYLEQLAGHLHSRRSALLKIWRARVHADPELVTPNGLSRASLNDHLPKILTTLEERLRADVSIEQADHKQRAQAAQHGSHRWQQGYHFRETLREWGHLQQALLDELESFSNETPGATREGSKQARDIVAALFMEGSCESAGQYLQFQQAEAAGRVRELEQSLTSLQRLETERAILLRQTAHDLRGSVGIFATVNKVLAQPEVLASQRRHFHEVLDKHIDSMSGLLTEWIALARLEAGQETVQIHRFDAAVTLRQAVESTRLLAASRGLFLRSEGPSLWMDGDSTKVQRIVQNLLLNSIRATDRGGVIVRWALHSSGGANQWSFEVQDSGSGMKVPAPTPLRTVLEQVTEAAHSADAIEHGETTITPQSPSDAAQTIVPAGEGVGLAIVKRLCELLAASIEFESVPGHGTTVKITLPLRYVSVREEG